MKHIMMYTRTHGYFCLEQANLKCKPLSLSTCSCPAAIRANSPDDLTRHHLQEGIGGNNMPPDVEEGEEGGGALGSEEEPRATCHEGGRAWDGRTNLSGKWLGWKVVVGKVSGWVKGG